MLNSYRWNTIVDLWDKLDREKHHIVSLEFERSIFKILKKDKIIGVTQLKADEAYDKIERFTSAELPWLLIDIPGARPGSTIGLYSVLEGQRRQLRKDDRAVGDLQVSDVWERYARDLRQTAGKIRIFCEPTLVDTIESSLSWNEGLDQFEGVLSQLTT